VSLIGENHFYAKRTKDGEEIHISDAASGRGYNCLGCQRDMQAVRHKLTGYTDYFRHDAKYVQAGNKCTFSDQIYRKGIAITSLLLEKRIKVPAILKFHPTDRNAAPMVIKLSCIIEAYDAKSNLVIYENEFGQLTIGTEIPEGNNNQLFKPDVVFFDRAGSPQLLLEIVTKFKVSDEVKANLRRIGINTLQITLPKESREAIYNSLFQTDRAKWIYTNEQQFTGYIQPSRGDNGGGETIDEFERCLHEESVVCRINQIANLIRSVGKCYQSKQYVEIEQGFSRELLEVRRTIERNRKRRLELESEFREELDQQYHDNFETIAAGQSELKHEQNRFSVYKSNLERRYREKVEELFDEERTIAYEEQELVGQEARFEKEENSIDLDLGRPELRMRLSAISGETDEVTKDISDTETAVLELQQRIDALQPNLEERREGAERESTAEIETIRKHEERLPADFGQQGIALEKQFERLRADAVTAIEKRDSSGSTGISGHIKTLFNRRAKLADLEQVGRLIESIKKGAYKNWV
jgi:hypothetical protein